MTTALPRDLARLISGDVRDDDASRAAYASDASNHRVLPECVVLPTDSDDIAAVVAFCAERGIPITARGAGTNVAGNAIGPGIVLDTSRHLDRVLTVDPDAGTATVQPGVILDRLQRDTAPHGLRFGPDPSTHNRCTIGGMIGTNACGSHSVAWGTTADNVRALDVVLGDGSLARLGREPDSDLAERLRAVRDTHLAPIRRDLGRFPRQISGYGLHYLLPERGFDVAKAFTGSEGTCGIITSATLDLVRPPRHQALVVAGFADDIGAASAAPTLAGGHPLTVEGIDHNLVRAFDNAPAPRSRPELPRGQAWLLVELGADDPGAMAERADELARLCRDTGAVETNMHTDPATRQRFWQIRELGAGLATRTADGRETWPGWEDAAVPPERLGKYLADFRRLLADHGRHGVVYGHFGEGCVHVRIDHDLLSQDGRAAYRRFQADAAELVVAHEGSLSGEHGDGRARSELLTRLYGRDVIDAFAAFKHAFDPANLLNPGVLIDPDPLDDNLRLHINRPHTVDLAFGYQGDDGDWGKAMRRCVGVGACRKESGGGMCPSYRATKDERHSTRGRARILFEMLDGHLGDDGWRSEDVREALDLCLGCKACTSECPVSVDMATYKAEFLHQHYRRRPRPASHYSMGWLPLWLAVARRVPRLANPLLGRKALARLGGIDPRRSMPRLSARPWRSRRALPGSGGTPITLWADTFTASFAPEIITDAEEVLAAAGYATSVAGPNLCCGLTWISTGQLGIARRVLSRTVDALHQAPGDVVVLEPSCAAALRHDAPNLLGTKQATSVASRVRTLAEVIEPARLDLAPLNEAAVAQFHCHHRAVFGTEPDRRLLRATGVDLTSVDDGCCGLAGNFGFENGHYDVSVRCAEQSFLPVVREAGDRLVLADGFSCRLQIEQLADRPSLHLAQLLRRQLRQPSTVEHS